MNAVAYRISQNAEPHATVGRHVLDQCTHFVRTI
jgi:hypothetical protein